MSCRICGLEHETSACPKVESLLAADAARPRPLETVEYLRELMAERSEIGKKWILLADQRGAEIERLKGELAELRALYNRPVMVDHGHFMLDGDIRKLESALVKANEEIARLRAEGVK